MIAKLFSKSKLLKVTEKIDLLEGTFSLVDLQSFFTDKIDNRKNSSWKNAEFIGVKTFLSDRELSRLLKQWKLLEWRKQFLCIIQSQGYKLFNSIGECVCEGEGEILNFLINHCAKEEKKKDDRLSLALRAFKSFRSTEDGIKFCEMVNGSVREFYSQCGEITKENFKDLCLSRTWTGTNGGGCWSQLIKSDWDACSVLFNQLRTENKFTLSHFKEKKSEYPHAVGPKLVSEILMKFHPDTYCYYNKRAHAILKNLGVIDFEFKDYYSAQDYARVYGAYTFIRDEMRKLNIEKTCEEGSGDADYLAVNEFIYFVSTHEEFIKEEMMKQQLKPVVRKPCKGTNSLDPNDELMIRLMAALRTKPFAILAGHSGTGKSRMVRRLAYMTCRDKTLLGEDTPGNFCMIQVKPNWHESTDLLGYYSALEKSYKTTDFVKFLVKAYAYPNVPFFVCLDEMNLAPVEQYFAEYLSAIESAKKQGADILTDRLISKDVEIADLKCEYHESVDWLKAHGLTIPKNLFVVGTVNMDETTCQFSRKVLDRAMTIEMNEVNFGSFGFVPPTPDQTLLLKDEVIDKLLDREVNFTVEENDALRLNIVTKLESLKSCLEGTPFQIAYRFANEFGLYAQSLQAFGKDDVDVAFDHMVLMKVLPRIMGEAEKVLDIFGKKGTANGLRHVVKEDGLSVKKMNEIEARDESYLSFWP